MSEAIMCKTLAIFQMISEKPAFTTLGPAEKFQILRFECFPTEWGNSLHNVNNSYGESPSRNPLGTSVLPIETFILLTMPFQKSLKYHSSKSLLIR